MKIRILPIFLTFIFLIVFFIFYQGLQNPNTYVPNTNFKKDIPSFKAKMFETKITYLKPRLGERYASALTKMSNNRRIINKYGKIDLKDYVTSFIKG